ncbi:hypothetical protein DW757_01015 [Clostridium sp. AM29-11AC]|nr:hypothetical protein CLOM621_07974 [Clostridium sp. M62/1]RHT59539.1 hypothetical protein DW757_01015 [Clostridium sp. AM29-11AC]CBL36026.1 hypothetical protein CL3_12660 [butyrate-producing bacterium SM4/1]
MEIPKNLLISYRIITDRLFLCKKTAKRPVILSAFFAKAEALRPFQILFGFLIVCLPFFVPTP